ncbi:hypothetical protein FQA39_LY07609 [Lamprigera yunnana]|nr:hypothetical protein FQA39_LY07609 [Lamprigera yunnana]
MIDSMIHLIDEKQKIYSVEHPTTFLGQLKTCLNKLLVEGETVPEKQNEPPADTNASTHVKCTPGKILDIISPVPVASANVDSVRRRSKQLAAILTTETTIGEKKSKATKTTQKEKNTSKIKLVFKKSKVTKKDTKKASKNDSSSDEDLEAPTLNDFSDDMDDVDEACTGCGKTYSQTTKSDHWVNCLR